MKEIRLMLRVGRRRRWSGDLQDDEEGYEGVECCYKEEGRHGKVLDSNGEKDKRILMALQY